MIKPDQIPDEVVEAAADEVQDWTGVSRDSATHIARAVIAAAVNAWPGGWDERLPHHVGNYFILPIPHEPPHD